MAISKETLEYRIKVITDNAKAELKGVADEARNAGAALSDAAEATGKVGPRVNKAAAETKKLSDGLAGVGNASSAAAPKVAQVAQEADHLDESFAGASGGIGGFLPSLKAGFQGIQLPIIAMNQALALAQMAFQGLKGAMDAVVGSAIDMELSVAKIQTLMTAQDRATVNVTENLYALQEQFGGDARATAESYYEVLSSGAVDAAGSLELMQTAQKLSVAGVASLTSSTKVLTAVMAAYGLGAERAGEVAETLFIAARDGKTDVEGLAAQFGVVVPMAAQLGVSFREVAAAASTITTAGISTSETMTSLNATMRALTVGTEPMKVALKQVFKEMKVGSLEAAIAQEGLVKVVQRLVKIGGAGGISGVAEMFGGEAMKAVATLTGNLGSRFEQTMLNMAEAAKRPGEVLNTAFLEVMATTSKQLDVLMGRMYVLGARMGEAILPAVKMILSGINAILDVASRMGDVARALDLSGIYDRNKVAIDGVIVALGTLMAMYAVSKWTAIYAGIAQVVTGFVAMKAAIIAATIAAAPFFLIAAKVILVGAAIGGVVIAIDFLVRNFHLLVDIAVNTFDKIQIKAYELRKSMLGIIDSDWTRSEIKKTEDQISKLSLGMRNTSREWDKGLGGDLASSIGKAWDAFQGKAEDATKATDNLTKSTKEAAAAVRALPKIQPPDPETLKRYESIASGITSLRDNVNRLTMSEEDYVSSIAKRALVEIKAVTDTLKSEGRLTEERARTLRDAATLVEAQKNGELKKIMDDRASTYLETEIEIAKIMRDETKVIALELDKQKRDYDRSLKSRKITAVQYLDLVSSIGLQKERAFLDVEPAGYKEALASLKEIKTAQEEQGISAEARALKQYDALEMQLKVLQSQLEANLSLAKTDEVRLSIMERMAAISDLTGALPEARRKTEKAQDEKAIVESAMPDWIGQLKSVFEDDTYISRYSAIASKFSESFTGALSPITGMMSAANTVVDAVQQLIDFIPGIINKVSNVINSLTSLPLDIANAVLGLVDSLINFTKNFIPNILKAIPILGEALVGIVKEIPNAFIELINGLPKVIMSVWEQLPGMAKALTTALISNMPRISIALIRALLIGIPDLIQAAMTLLYRDLPIALAQGIRDAFYLIGDDLASIFYDMFGRGASGVTDTLKKAGGAIAGVSDELFAVLDEGAGNQSRALGEIIRKETARAVGLLRQAWEALKQAWRWINTNILQPLLSGLFSVFSWVRENILNPIAGVVMGAFGWVVDNVLSPMMGIVSAAFGWVGTNILQPLANVVMLAFSPIMEFFNALPGLFSNLWAGVKTLFTGLFTFDWDAIKSGFTQVFQSVFAAAFLPFKVMANGIIDLLNGLVLPKFSFTIPTPWKDYGVNVWKEKDLIPGTIARLATGGQVPNTPNLSGFGSDSVAAALTPGEFVLNRNAAQSLGAPLLERMNMTGKLPGGSVSQENNITLNIKTEQPIDESFVRNKLIPEIEKSLRRLSLDGRRVLSPAGVR